MEYRARNRVDENGATSPRFAIPRRDPQHVINYCIFYTDRFSSKPDLVRLATSSVIENFIAPQLAHLPRAYGFPAECSNTEIELKLRHGEPLPAPPSHCIFTIRPGHARGTAREYAMLDSPSRFRAQLCFFRNCSLLLTISHCQFRNASHSK